MSKLIGIDLGTDSSTVAVLEDGVLMIIPTQEGYAHTPSVVAYTKEGCLVGAAAKQRLVLHPEDTFPGVMRFIGRNYDEVTELAKQVPYKVLRGKNGQVEFACPVLDQTLTSEDILAEILRKLAEDANRYLGEEVTQAVIAVPACLYLNERLAIKQAACKAGLEVLRFINSTDASAIAYELNHSSSDNHSSSETVLFFGLGSGYLSISIFEIGDNVFEAVATTGDRLGGDDFTWRIVDDLVQEFRKVQGPDLRRNQQAMQRIWEAAEQAKIELSSLTQTEINLPFITAVQTHVPSPHAPATHSKSGNSLRNLVELYQLGVAEAKQDHLRQNSQPSVVAAILDQDAVRLQALLTRTRFNELCKDLVDCCRILVENVMRDAKKDKNSIDKIVLVGGSTHIPAIQELVQQALTKTNQIIDPDEGVAIGTAIQAGALAGRVKDVLLLDVIPFSLGVETLGGVMTKLIPRNTTIPTEKSEVFSTSTDGQRSMEIHVLQGEREMSSDNKSLGMFCLDGIPPAPRGVAQIQVTFDIDANLMLVVTAKDKNTGKSQSIVLPDNSLPLEQCRNIQKNLLPAHSDFRSPESISSKHVVSSEPVVNLFPGLTSQACSNCHNQVSVTDNFCSKCGHKLHYTTPKLSTFETLPNRSLYCLNCQKFVPRDTIYCPTCGCQL